MIESQLSSPSVNRSKSDLASISSNSKRKNSVLLSITSIFQFPVFVLTQTDNTVRYKLGVLCGSYGKVFALPQYKNYIRSIKASPAAPLLKILDSMLENEQVGRYTLPNTSAGAHITF